MNIVNDILVNTLFPDTDFVQTLAMNSVVPKYVENQEKGNPSVCKNCAEAPFRDLHIYGRSEQMTTTGAQLLDFSDLIGKTETKNGATYKINEDQSVSVSGTPTKYTSFYLKGISLKAGSYYFINGQNSNEVFVQLIGKGGMSKNFTLTEDTDVSVYVVFNVNENNTKTFDSTIKAMLNTGSTALPWEPYTGGKPSPSPDYPQEIVSAGEDGNLNVMVRGKNLISPNIEWGKAGWAPGTVKNTEGVVIANAVNGWGVFAFHSPAVGKTVTLSITYRQIETTSDDTTDAFAVVTLPSIAYPKSSGVLYTTSSPKTEESKINVTFTSDEYIGVYIRVSKENAGLMRKVELRDIQLEESSKPTAYEPYHELQSMSITTPNGLPGILVTSDGNYTDENGQQWICDEVEFGRGVYVQRVKVKELSPDDRWTYRKLASGNNNYQARIYGEDVAKNYFPSICNILPFKNVRWDDNIQNLPKIYAINQEITASFPPNSEYSSLEAFKQLLTNVKSVIYYALATPIETPLTASEIAAYKSLRTYRGTTIVEAEDKAGIYVKYNMPMPKLSKNGALRRWFKRHPII